MFFADRGAAQRSFFLVAISDVGADTDSASRHGQLASWQAMLPRKFLHTYGELVRADLLGTALPDAPDPPLGPLTRPTHAGTGIEPVSAAKRLHLGGTTDRFAAVARPVALVERVRAMQHVRGLIIAEPGKAA